MLSVAMDNTQYYYKHDLSKLSLSEFIHHTSLLKGIVTWVLVNIGAVNKPTTPGTLLPLRAYRLLQNNQTLSARCQELFSPALESLHKLSFDIGYYDKQLYSLTPHSIDTGGCYLLHKTGQYYATVLYSRNRIPPAFTMEQERLHYFFVSRFASGKRLVVTNSKLTQPFSLKVLNTTLHLAKTSSLIELFQLFEEKFTTWQRRDKVLPINSINELGQIMEADSVKVLEASIKTGRVILMTDQEVAAAMQKLRNSQAGIKY